MSDSMIPEFLPTLSAGAHAPGSGEACVMEYVSLLAGEDWSDSPACTHPALAAIARNVNDRLPDCERHRLVPLIGRLFGTAPSGSKRERHVLSVRLAVWAAREVLAFTGEDRAVCEAAISAAEGWCEGTVSAEECGAAYAAANAAARDAANAYAAAAYAANAAADAANAAADAAYAAYAAAANAAYAAAANADLVDLLSRLIDEYDRLTGRTEHRHVSDGELRALAEAISL